MDIHGHTRTGTDGHGQRRWDERKEEKRKEISEERKENRFLPLIGSRAGFCRNPDILGTDERRGR